ncbi:hypothetical protein FQN57_000691 [Myotisia sp. PD_48]|nr:hypothetical protein FQN57_000691 [Myotisia sp. PD_48]
MKLPIVLPPQILHPRQSTGVPDGPIDNNACNCLGGGAIAGIVIGTREASTHIVAPATQGPEAARAIQDGHPMCHLSQDTGEGAIMSKSQRERIVFVSIDEKVFRMLV